jgi:hypothetical protein
LFSGQSTSVKTTFSRRKKKVEKRKTEIGKRKKEGKEKEERRKILI